MRLRANSTFFCGILTCFLTLQAASAREASAEGNAPVLYTATTGGGCTLVDNGGQAVIEVRVNGLGGIPTRGALFGIRASQGFTGVVTSYAFPAGIVGFGNPADGFNVQYQGCLQPFTALLTVTYQLFGNSSGCGSIEVVPYPGEQAILVGDCNFDPVVTHSLGAVTVNPSAECTGQWCILATEPTTWGSVKALYR